MVYLDNAATSCPKPETVRRATCSALNSANPGRSGHDASMKAQQTVYTLRETAASFFHVSEPERVILTKNGTESLNIALRGLLGGGHVICSVFEHNSVLRPLELLRCRGEIEYSLAPVEADDERTLRAFASLLRPDTKAIVCTHASNVFGCVLPVKKLAQLAHENGLLFILDAAQSAGKYDIDMRDGYDAVCMPGHKGLYGPAGTGLLLLADGIEPQPLTAGGTGSFSHDRRQPSVLPDALESGTLNVPGAAGLTEGIRFVCSTGRRKILSHEKRLTEILSYELSHMRNILTYADEYEDKTLLSFNVVGMSSETVGSLLNESGIAVRAGFHCAYDAHRFMKTESTGTVRVSPGAFNTERDVEFLLKNLYKTAN